MHSHCFCGKSFNYYNNPVKVVRIPRSKLSSTYNYFVIVIIQIPMKIATHSYNFNTAYQVVNLHSMIKRTNHYSFVYFKIYKYSQT